MLASFHADSVQCHDRDDEGRLAPPGQIPVIGGVREAAGECEVRHQMSPIIERDEFGLGVIDDRFGDSDERSIEDEGRRWRGRRPI